jgi:nicotinic acid mononucleotide adenylyltransferase
VTISCELLQPDELRVIPAGNPWQKHGLQATSAQRVEMLELAFSHEHVPVVIDQQEIRAHDGNVHHRYLAAPCGPSSVPRSPSFS